MPKKIIPSKPANKLKPTFKKPGFKRYLWPKALWHKILLIIIAIFLFFTASMYGVAQWYIQKHKSEPLILGTTFIPDYAESFGLDPHQTLNAIFSDLNMKRVRLVSYWNDIEPVQGAYDFSKLDWQLAMANKYGAKVSLSIGLRQPRWPECHEPDWTHSLSKAQWQPLLNKYMTAVIERYKNNPALGEYQLENEFFMTVFGECKDFDRKRLESEFQMVKKLDPNHKVQISRSNNWIGLPVGKPTPDLFGVSVYKRVWDKTITHRYYEYPLPAWFYGALAGGGEIVTGKSMIIHELQTEPWPPTDIHEASIAEQYKSMSPQRFKNRISYGEATGIRTIDLWGVEWWYWMKETKHDPSIWNVAKQAVADSQFKNSLQK